MRYFPSIKQHMGLILFAFSCCAFTPTELDCSLNCPPTPLLRVTPEKFHNQQTRQLPFWTIPAIHQVSSTEHKTLLLGQQMAVSPILSSWPSAYFMGFLFQAQPQEVTGGVDLGCCQTQEQGWTAEWLVLQQWACASNCFCPTLRMWSFEGMQGTRDSGRKSMFSGTVGPRVLAFISS